VSHINDDKLCASKLAISVKVFCVSEVMES